MNCEEVRSLLDEWVDGELDEPTALALESHAASCPECARRLQFERRLKELVARKARAPEPPAYLAEKVRRAVGARSCRILEHPCGLVLYEKGTCRLSLFVFEEGAFAKFPALFRMVS